VSTVAFFLMALGMVLRNRHHPIVSGQEEMIGAVCVADESFSEQGKVRVHSERWTARTRTPLQKGDKAIVKSMEGLTLEVEAMAKEEEAS